MGYKNFGAETLHAADVNNYLMRQAVIRVNNATELAAITAPEPGMHAYRVDTGLVYIHNGTSWVQAGGITPWVTVALNSNSSFETGFPLQVRINGGRVEFLGRIRASSGTTGTAAINAATLPAAYRPPVQRLMPAGSVGGTVAQRIWVEPSGFLSFQSAANVTSVDLCGCSFPIV